MTTPTLPPEIAAALEDNRLNTPHREQRVAALIAEREKALVEATKDALISLVAAHSLLSGGGKRAAASDKMFKQMLVDYQRSIDRTRAALEKAGVL